MEKFDELIDMIDSKEKKETKSFFMKYLRNWYWFVIFLVIGAAAGYFIYANLPQKYLVSSSLLVKDENTSLSSSLNFENQQSSRNIGNNTNIENKVGIFKSYSLFKRALTNLGWETSWYRKKLFYEVDLYKNVPFELKLAPNAMNATNVPLSIEMLNENEYTVSAKGETTMNGYPQKIEFEQTARFGEPFLNDYFSFTLNKGNGEPDVTYVLIFNNINFLTNQYLKRTEITL